MEPNVDVLVVCEWGGNMRTDSSYDMNHICQQHNVSSISVTKIDVAFIDQSLVTSLVTKITYYFREIIDSEFLWRFSSIAWRKIQIIYPWKSYRTDSGLRALDCISEMKFWIPQRKSILTKNRNNIQLQLRELIFPKCVKKRESLLPRKVA